MKKGLLVLLLIAAFVAPAFAQSECPVGDVGDQKAKKVASVSSQAKKTVGNQGAYPSAGC